MSESTLIKHTFGKDCPLGGAFCDCAQPGASADGKEASVILADADTASLDSIETTTDATLPRGNVHTEATLDDAIAKVRAAETHAKESVIDCGRELRRIRDERLWTLRNGSPYSSFDDLVQTEFGRTAKWAYSYITVAERFTADDVLQHGVTKLQLLASVPEDDQPRVLAAIEGGASTRQVEAAVREIKSAKSYQRPSIGRSVPNNAGKPKPKSPVLERVEPAVEQQTPSDRAESAAETQAQTEETPVPLPPPPAERLVRLTRPSGAWLGKGELVLGSGCCNFPLKDGTELLVTIRWTGGSKGWVMGGVEQPQSAQAAASRRRGLTDQAAAAPAGGTPAPGAPSRQDRARARRARARVARARDLDRAASGGAA